MFTVAQDIAESLHKLEETEVIDEPAPIKELIKPTDAELLALIRPLIPPPEKGDPGKDYVLTEKDKKQIAKSIPVPVVEKIIEKTEVIHEQPIVTNEIKEVAVKDTPEEIIEKINEDEDNLIKREKIEGLAEEFKRVEGKIPTIRGGGSKGVQLFINGARQGLTTQAINLIGGTNVTLAVTQVNGVSTVSFSSSGASANQSNNETPSGLINSSNTVFTLAHTPAPAASLKVYLNGAFQTAAGEDYTLATATITFINAPPTGSVLRVFYDYA